MLEEEDEKNNQICCLQHSHLNESSDLFFQIEIYMECSSKQIYLNVPAGEYAELVLFLFSLHFYGCFVTYFYLL